MPSQLFPEVIDQSDIAPLYSSPQFFTPGVEGEADSNGSATVGVLYSVDRPSTSDNLFGASSPLGKLIKFFLSRGVYPVVAGCSAKGSVPDLTARKAVWQNLEAQSIVRIRMTDDTAQATLDGLAKSCAYAELLQNKQTGFGGLASGSDKATLIAAAASVRSQSIETAGPVPSQRFCLVAPGVYDPSGTLLSGNMAALAVACEVARNADLSNDLDLWPLSNLIGIELSNIKQPVFRQYVNAGSVVNDFEDLLQGGVSPVMLNRAGNGVQISHLRTCYTADSRYDALETRLIQDQLFVEIRQDVEPFLRAQNTPSNRMRIATTVSSRLTNRNSWVAPIRQGDGTISYGISVTTSDDNRQIIIGYQGQIIRSPSTILVDEQLQIPV